MENDVLQRIREVIESKRMSVTGISKAINIPQATLYKQIAGESAMTLKTLSVLLDYFEDVSAEWLLRGKGEMKLPYENYILSDSFEMQPWKKSTNQEKGLQESNSEIEEKSRYIKHFSHVQISKHIIQDYQKMNEALIELNKKQQKQMDEFISIISNKIIIPHTEIKKSKEEK